MESSSSKLLYQMDRMIQRGLNIDASLKLVRVYERQTEIINLPSFDLSLSVSSIAVMKFSTIAAIYIYIYIYIYMYIDFHLLTN